MKDLEFRNVEGDEINGGNKEKKLNTVFMENQVRVSKDEREKSEEQHEKDVQEADDLLDGYIYGEDVKFNDLCQKEVLTDEEVDFVVKYENENGVWALSLNKLKSITDEQAKKLSNVRALWLDWLTSITDKQAEELSKVWILFIGLRSITDKQAEYFSKLKLLALDKLESVTDNQLEYLAKIKKLSINKYIILTPRQKEILWKNYENKYIVLTPMQKEILWKEFWEN